MHGKLSDVHSGKLERGKRAASPTQKSSKFPGSPKAFSPRNQIPNGLYSSVDLTKGHQSQQGSGESGIRTLADLKTQSTQYKMGKIYIDITPEIKAKMNQLYETTYEADYSWRKKPLDHSYEEGLDKEGFKQMERTKIGKTNAIEITTPFRANWNQKGGKNGNNNEHDYRDHINSSLILATQNQPQQDHPASQTLDEINLNNSFEVLNNSVIGEGHRPQPQHASKVKGPGNHEANLENHDFDPKQMILEKIDAVIDENPKYYQHVAGNCGCKSFKSGNCQGCKMFPSFKVFPNSTRSIYQNDFKSGGALARSQLKMPERGRETSLRFTEKNSNQEYRSVQRAEYVDPKVVYQRNMPHYQTISKEPNLSSMTTYQNEYLNYGSQGAMGVFKLPQRINNLSELPFINRTTYRDNYTKLQLGNNKRPNFPKIANPLASKMPFRGMPTTKEDYPKRTLYMSDIYPASKRTVDEKLTYPGHYKSITRNDYIAKKAYKEEPENISDNIEKVKNLFKALV